MRHISTITDQDITGSDKLSFATPRVAVNAVLLDADGKIALSYVGKYGLHTLPGGGVESGEDLHTAVKREMWEETGCDCTIIGELGKIIENRAELDFIQERSYFIAKVIGEKGCLHLTGEEMAENTTVVWTTPEQALKIISEKKHDSYKYKFFRKRDVVALEQALIWLQIHDIPEFSKFTQIEPVTKGWSEDKKYCVATADGTKYLLRISPASRFEARESLFTMMGKVAALKIPMCMPVGFGVCSGDNSLKGEVYSLQSWIDGEDLEKVLPLLSKEEQYELGLKSGGILKTIHSIPAPETNAGTVGVEDWETRFNRKTDHKKRKYLECGLRFNGDEHVLRYLEENRNLLKNRPQCFQHGDYHVGNMMIEKGSIHLTDALKIIDFDRYDFGDPWEEFNRIVWSATASPHFATGQLRGYFGGEPPTEFWRLLAFYIASNTLSSIYWAIPFGKSDIDIMMKQSQDVLAWFDNMRDPVPTWYSSDIKSGGNVYEYFH